MTLLLNNLVMVNRYTYDLIFSALGTRSLLEKHRVCFLMMDFKQSVWCYSAQSEFVSRILITPLYESPQRQH